MKDILKFFRHAPLLFYPFMFTQPAFGQDEEAMEDVAESVLNVESELISNFAQEV